MKLSTFITRNLEEIIAEWEAFAQTLLPASSGMSATDLRDHAKQILTAIAKDIDTSESPTQQEEKSKGKGSASDDNAASTHGTLRQASGFTLHQLIAEYRALRATVLRLWLQNTTPMTEDASDDMVRFNEAIDQALTESATKYSAHASAVRDTFLAILGHDLRSPLSTMTMAGDYLTQQAVDADITLQVGLRVKRSAATMTSMVNDLLEYARTQLDGKIPVERAPVNVEEICQSALENAKATYPDCPFELKADEDLVGNFDTNRLEQVFSNLLNNAAQYRAGERPVTIVIEGKEDAIGVHIHNFGRSMPAESLKTIFDPLVQLPLVEPQAGRPASSLGLGLFIAREITEAHGGTISVESDDVSGTTFSVRLPREHTNKN